METTVEDMKFRYFRRKGLSEMIGYQDFKQNGGEVSCVSFSIPDQELAVNNPKEFDKGFVARNPDNHKDMWYVAYEYHSKNLEEVPATETFYERLIRERDELAEKVDKLSAFLSNETKAKQISGETQYSLLFKQRHYMYEYLTILNKRIDDLDMSAS